MVERNINILFISAECAPLAKIGGLADVVGALPKALVKHQNTSLDICLPLYKHLTHLKNKKNFVGLLRMGRNQNVKIYKTLLPSSDITVYLFFNKKYLSDKNIYLNPHTHSSDSNQERFGFFNLAFIEFLKKIKPNTNIIHCHDWHAGLIPYLIKKETKLAHIKTVFTIHNINNQGIWLKTQAQKLNINFPKVKNKYINFIETGIRYANYVTTVSPSYAKEILIKKYGYNLVPLLKQKKSRLVGILNGIDVEEFNPATDKKIDYNYNIKTLSIKNKNKTKLQIIAGLPIKPKKLLLGAVTRLYEQKGLDWLVEIIPLLAKIKIQVVLLGTGDKMLEKKFKFLQNKYPDYLRVFIGFDIKLAQKIYAGSDAFLVPSRFEPCGLTQMIAMRYGTVPIIRATGGLKDSVVPFKKIKDKIIGNGFTFTQENSQTLFKTIAKAMKVYNNYDNWFNLQKNCMNEDFSWETSAKKYIALYKKLIH
jgi:starch synthase